MALSPGTRLGPYEVLTPLGAGGMGEVYRARDARLKRDVAIKVLPEALSRNADALARFEREALAVAALSHSGILSIFDVGEENGVRYAVTELLEGETLRAYGARGPAPLKRTLDIVRQLADALAAAHEKGIVHRDVKPDNVFLTRDGRAKLLDFGLARGSLGFRDADDSLSPTASALTGAGAVVGTVAYMSPEQASGHPVDYRSDQFSLGIVLYELLAGRRPFSRPTAAETLTAILREEPEPLEKAAPATPAPVRWLVERLLHKEAGGRYAATRDLAHELATLCAHLSETTTAVTGVAASAPPRRARLAAAGLAISVATAAVLGVLVVRVRHPPRAAAGRFEVRLPDGHFLEPYRRAVALSQDGTRLVFSAQSWRGFRGNPDERRLFLRRLDSLEIRPIPGTEGAFEPVLSPDGDHVAFAAYSGGKWTLKRVPVTGGPVQSVCECQAIFGAAWTPDGNILFGGAYGPLQRVPATGGTPESVTTLDEAGGEVSHRLPHLLPDGRTIIYTALRWRTVGMTWEKARIYSFRPGEGEERSLLVEGGSDGRWAPPGVLLFAREGNLLAAPLDARSRRVAGTPTKILEGVRHSIWTGTDISDIGAAEVAVSAGGLLAWVPGSVSPPHPAVLSWVDRSGRETPLEGEPLPADVVTQRISPDGRRVLVSYSYPGTHAEVVDLARGSRRQVTFDEDAGPVWAIWGPGPDRITYTSYREGPAGLYTRKIDAGPEEVETLWKKPQGDSLAVGSWSRDGKVLAFTRFTDATGFDIFLLEPGKEPRPFLASPFHEAYPDISPDGKWLLYTSNESGRAEVFVRALSGEGDTVQVSPGPGGESPRKGFVTPEPLWSRDGRRVYYWQPVEGKPGVKALFRVSVTPAAGRLDIGVPERLFEGSYYFSFPAQGWDVGPDDRFLVAKLAGDKADSTFLEKVFTDRIVVDTGGLARLLADAKVGQ